MRRALLAAGVAGAIGGALASGLAVAQRTPESLLPPGFDDPEPTATPTPALPTAAPVSPRPARPATAPPAPGDATLQGPITLPPVSELTDEELRNLPSLEELEQLTTDELDDLFGLKPEYDIPPAARRTLAQVGVIAPVEGGFSIRSLAKQPPALVRAALAGTQTPLVSRWGHILMRRAVASRLQAPEGMDPVAFAALRAGALNRLGEYAVARAIIQDVDTANWTDALAQEALTAFVAEADPVGLCPYVRFQGTPDVDGDKGVQWTMISAICNAYAGEGALAGSQLDAALNNEIAPAIDILLARRFAGAAGRGQRAVSIEWEGVEELNPWRFALANAVGEPVPEPLLADTPSYYARAGADAPMVPLAQRADYAARAGEEGIFSSQALIDLYSEIYSDSAIGGVVGDRARSLRLAYLASEPSDRIDAMQDLWGDTQSGDTHWAQVLTAYASARIPASPDHRDQAGQLIASMLSAGLDRDAASWQPVVSQGSLGWALLALANPDGGAASREGLDAFFDADRSAQARKSRFLIAGLAGLGRLRAPDRADFEDELSLGLERQTRWARMIGRAAEVENPALVALLAGLGMQGEDWSQMTPLHLYRITAALNDVGLEAYARMIAAEAVARA
ncbi:MAG: hypothetical protein QNI87_02420 [Erythrobacter sp.]|uniref:hypothetical protein n=1 Tax=Erythrobacter sp. TaxID=1042 RepID=UPI0026043B7D|nr:hypothetical protein [Erythrobacter sp.]MDJ0977369.1 hypothetical protein [Erythrobacter sp.]